MQDSLLKLLLTDFSRIHIEDDPTRATERNRKSEDTSECHSNSVFFDGFGFVHMSFSISCQNYLPFDFVDEWRIWRKPALCVGKDEGRWRRIRIIGGCIVLSIWDRYEYCIIIHSIEDSCELLLDLFNWNLV